MSEKSKGKLDVVMLEEREKMEMTWGRGDMLLSGNLAEASEEVSGRTESEEEEEEDMNPKRPNNWRKWPVLGSLVVALIGNGISLSFFSITSTVFKHDIGLWWIHGVALLYMGLYPIISIISNKYIIDRGGLSFGITLGAIFLIINLWLKIVIDKDSTYLFVFIGIAGGIAQPLLINAHTKAVLLWFPFNLWGFANACGGMATPIGASIGMLGYLPNFQISQCEIPFDPEISHKLLNSLKRAGKIEAVVLTLFLVVGLIVIWNWQHPKLADFFAETQPRRLRHLTDLLARKSYGVLLFSSLVFLTFINVCALRMDIFLAPMGLSPRDMSQLAFAYGGGGIIGSISIYMIFWHRSGDEASQLSHRKYKLPFNVLLTCSTVFFICLAFWLCIHADSGYERWESAILYILSGVLGMSMIPIVFVSIEYSIELTFHQSKTNSSAGGIFYMGSNLLSLLLLLGVLLPIHFINDNNGCSSILIIKIYLVIAGSLFVLSLIGSFFLMENYEDKYLARTHAIVNGIPLRDDDICQSDENEEYSIN